ncbi:hypothetical protein TRVA0_025S01552 [Trichomonascus vanleenenianus]|uniref:uncharacterized protein n=1 Tax=Trichomonascus vanleenenianus TaxID=2268995 RepID=UPI003EC9DC01
MKRPREEDFVRHKKYYKAFEETQTTILCNLPPTCSETPVELTDSEFEQHYYDCHTFHCFECRGRFPSEHLLDLHLRELHDHLVAELRDRGESVFKCFVESCPRVFKTSVDRNEHAVSDHGYPQDYGFDIVRKGLTSTQ